MVKQMLNSLTKVFLVKLVPIILSMLNFYQRTVISILYLSTIIST